MLAIETSGGVLGAMVHGLDLARPFSRAEFGITAGKDWGFSMDVALRIQVEAVAGK